MIHSQIARADVTFDEISKVYNHSRKHVEKSIKGIFNKFQAEYGLSKKEAEQVIKIMRTKNKKLIPALSLLPSTPKIKQTIESTTGTMKLLISSIAFISLIVGGIGVMNIMLVSVTERTKEIGVRMAIGARQFNILQQFLIEAVLICLIGGVTGILLSGLIGLLFNVFMTDFTMAFSTGSIVAAVVFSTLIGVIFGYMPAKRAAQLDPITALARE